jgi:GAF domain-containing protein
MLVTASSTPLLGDPLAPADERRILYAIIRTVSSTVDLETVLSAVVQLITEGAKAQSCFIWINDPHGRLVLRAASGRYAATVGRATLAPGEGFAGWVAANRQPIFLPEDALADPRARYFPEFEEEKYQSMVSVPLIGKDDAVFGVIGIHSVAPRVLTPDDANFVLHSASLVAGAIENARLYDAARRRVAELEQLSRVSDQAARASSADELLPVVVTAACDLLGAQQAVVYLTERDERLVRRAGAPDTLGTPVVIGLEDASDVGARVWRNGAATLCVPLAADGQLLGYLVARGDGAFPPELRDRAMTIASQTAVGLKKIQLIEGLAEKNLIKDFFADLVAGRLEGVATRARRLGCDLSSPRLAVVARPWKPARRSDSERIAAIERFESEVARALPGVLFDHRDDQTRGLVPMLSGDESDALRRLERALGDLPLVVGVSNPCVGAEAVVVGLSEASEAARAAPVVADTPTVLTYDGLGPYKYLLRVRGDEAARDRHREALRRLLAYDRQRHAQLARTLEQYLARRGNMAATAAALYVHPNTLRQRLRRIQELTGLDLRSDDWLMIEIAL